MKTANATNPVVRAAKQSIILSVLLVLIVFSGRGNAQSNSQHAGETGDRVKAGGGRHVGTANECDASRRLPTSCRASS